MSEFEESNNNLEWLGDFKCDTCGKPTWVVWDLTEPKPESVKCCYSPCRGYARPDPNGEPDRQKLKLDKRKSWVVRED